MADDNSTDDGEPATDTDPDTDEPPDASEEGSIQINPENLDAATQCTLIAQYRRQQAYADGDYELSDEEGYWCDDCEWQGLNAVIDIEIDPDSDPEDLLLCYCPECGAPVTTRNSPDTYLDPFKPDPSDLDEIDDVPY